MSGEMVTHTNVGRWVRSAVALIAAGGLAVAGLVASAHTARADGLTADGDLTVTQTMSPDAIPLGGTKITFTVTVRNESSSKVYQVNSVTGDACLNFLMVRGQELIQPQGTAIFQCSTYSFFTVDNRVQVSAQPVANASSPETPASAAKAYYCSTETPLIAFQHSAGTTFATLDEKSKGYSSLGGASPLTYDALAYRMSDGYTYAISAEGKLLRISLGGSVDDLGPITGLSASDRSAMSGGTFAEDTYYAVAGKGSGTAYAIDIATRTANPLMSDPLPVADITYANGALWGLSDPAKVRQLTLYRLNLPGERVRAYDVANVLPASSGDVYGAAWTNAQGRLVFASQSGTVYQLSIKDGEAGLSIGLAGTSKTTPAQGLDGTVCPASPNAPQTPESSTPTTAPTSARPSATAPAAGGTKSADAVATRRPSPEPSVTMRPSEAPSVTPSAKRPTAQPTAAPSRKPTESALPTLKPEPSPTKTSDPKQSTVATAPSTSVASPTTTQSAPERPQGHVVEEPPSIGLSVGVSKDLPKVTKVGDAIVFSFDITNHSSSVMSKIAVEAPLLQTAGLAVACEHDLLAPGVTATCMSQPYPVSEADLAMGSVTARATAKGFVDGKKLMSQMSSAAVPVGAFAQAETLGEGQASGTPQATAVASEPADFHKVPEIDPNKSSGSSAERSSQGPVLARTGALDANLPAGIGFVLLLAGAYLWRRGRRA